MNEIVEFIARHKVVVICRGLYEAELVKTIKALYAGGIRIVEVTFDQADPDAIAKTCCAIRTIKEHFPQMKVGSGTVTCVEHLKDIKGPINHVKFLAAAGVNEDNFKDYLNAGYCAAGISGRFIDRTVIAEGNFAELTRRARIFTDIAKAC